MRLNKKLEMFLNIWDNEGKKNSSWYDKHDLIWKYG